MSEVTQFATGRLRRGLSSRTRDKKKVESFFYPQKKLYSKEELELLDSLYSDRSSDSDEAIMNELKPETEFWQEEKMHFSRRIPLTTKIKWFASGMVLTSLVWLIYFQLSGHTIGSYTRPKIVFKTAATIVTDKSFDREITHGLGESRLALARVKNENKFSLPFISGLLAKKPEEAKATKESSIGSNVKVVENVSEENSSSTLPATYHVIKNGDSLWLIAKEYYGNPTPENIKKIMDANKLTPVSYLYPGKKIVIPL